MIEGKLINLTALSSKHLDFMLSLLNNQDIAYLEGRAESLISIEKQKAWFEKSVYSSNQYYVIETKLESLPVGYMSLKIQNNISGNAQLAIKLTPNAQGKGFGTDAVKIITRHCFFTFNLHRLYSHIVAYNTPSQKMFLDKCFWRKEGVEKESVYTNGQYHDNILIALLKNEFISNEKDVFYNPLSNQNI